MEKKDRKLTFLFGAGASYAAGFPLQNQLLRKILNEIGEKAKSAKFLRRFIAQIYNLDFKSNRGSLPSIEHLLGILEYSLDEYSPLGSQYMPSDILSVRKALIAGLVHSLSGTSEEPREIGLYKTLIGQISGSDIPWLNVSFITLNYDLLLDTSFDHLFPEAKLDFGLEFLNYEGILTDGFNWWVKPDNPGQSIKLLKPHGSLSFNYCPFCQCVELIPFGLMYRPIDEGESPEKLFEILDAGKLECPRDKQPSMILVVPPSLSKRMEIAPIKTLWARTARVLLETTHLCFIGYSLPLADLHIWHLLRQCALLNQPRQVIIVDAPQPADTDSQKRYKHIYGRVEYLPIGFEKFVEENKCLSLLE